jgi:hypothetical protein
MARVDMHEGVESSNMDSIGANHANQSPEKIKLVRKINKWYEKAQRHREKFDHSWLDHYRFFRGRQWKEKRPSYRHSAVFNLVWRVIQSQVPILTDAQPRIEFLPQEPQDREFAEILSQVAEFDWEKRNWTLELAEALYDANIYGTAFGSIMFDEKAEFGLGAVDFDAVDPFYVYPDPGAKDIKDADYLIIAEPMLTEKIKAKYPKFKEQVKADLQDFDAEERKNLDNIRFRSPVDNKTLLEGTSSVENIDQDLGLLLTVWFKDSAVKKGKKGEDDRLEFPKGRKVVMHNNVIMEDIPNPYQDGRFPYAKLVNYIDPHQFWGISEVENIEGPQQIYNKVFSFVLDVLTLTGNPIWIVDSASGIDVDNLLNQPGAILEPNPGSEVRRVEGTQLQPYVFQLLEKVEDVIDQVAGDRDVSRGVKPEGVTAARAIEALQDTAQTRLRQKSRFLDAFIEDIGRMYAHRALQFYTVPRVFRITNEQGSEQFFRLSVENVFGSDEGDVSQIATVTDLGVNELGEQVQGDERQFIISAEMDIKVSTGSALPFAKAERTSTALQLFDRQVIDAEEVLDVVEWPNKEAVLERMRQQQEAAALAEAQAQQGPLQG